MTERHLQAALALQEHHASGRRFDALGPDVVPLDSVAAYATQREFVGLLSEVDGSLVGYKIALTTKAMQEMVGLTSPVYGCVLSGRVHDSPATVPASEFIRLGVESEIAIRLGKDLSHTGSKFDRAAIADAVSEAMPAFELIDDRGADYSRIGASLLSIVADNAWNAGVVLGTPVTDSTIHDLATLRGVMTINNEAVGEGFGADVLGHPLDAVVWLANQLASTGETLKAGMIVPTGSVVTTKFVKSGDTVVFELEGAAPISLST